MRVTTKGQVTIPINIRENLGITPDTEVDFLQEGDRVFLVKRKGNTRAARKFKKLRSIATVKMTTDEIMALTRDDKFFSNTEDFEVSRSLLCRFFYRSAGCRIRS